MPARSPEPAKRWARPQSLRASAAGRRRSAISVRTSMAAEQRAAGVRGRILRNASARTRNGHAWPTMPPRYGRASCTFAAQTVLRVVRRVDYRVSYGIRPSRTRAVRLRARTGSTPAHDVNPSPCPRGPGYRHPCRLCERARGSAGSDAATAPAGRRQDAAGIRHAARTAVQPLLRHQHGAAAQAASRARRAS